MQIKKISGEITVLAAGVLWGCIGYFSRNLTEIGFSAVQMVAVRAILTCITLLVIIMIKDPKLAKVAPRDLWMFFGTGICSFIVLNVCYITSINENSLSVAGILLYTSPLWVTGLSVPVFKEKINLKTFISLLICFAGCIGVCSSSTLLITRKGLFIGLISGFGYALYSIFAKLASKKYNSLTIVFYTFVFAAAGLLPFCNIGGIVSMALEPRSAVLLIGTALLNTILPYLLYTYALARINAGKAAILSLIDPVTSAVVGYIFFSEKIGIIGFIGMALVIGGLVLLELSKTDNS